jgi:hypothetical protein
MYIFAEPYDEEEIDAIQNGEYFQALKLAEARARAEKEAKAAKALAELEEQERLEAEAAESVEAGALPTEAVESAEQVESEAEINAEADEPFDEESAVADSASEASEPAPTEETSAETVSSEHLSIEDSPANESGPDESDDIKYVIEDLGSDSEPDPDPTRPLLAMVLKVQNYINGNQITTPPTLGPTDKWEITYTFERYADDRARRLYAMCSERRRKAHDEEFREQAGESADEGRNSPADRVASGKVKAKDWNREFLAHLRDLSERGRQWREEFNRVFEGREKVVWREGMPPSKFGEMKWRGDEKRS